MSIICFRSNSTCYILPNTEICMQPFCTHRNICIIIIFLIDMNMQWRKIIQLIVWKCHLKSAEKCTKMYQQNILVQVSQKCRHIFPGALAWVFSLRGRFRGGTSWYHFSLLEITCFCTSLIIQKAQIFNKVHWRLICCKNKPTLVSQCIVLYYWFVTISVDNNTLIRSKKKSTNIWLGQYSFKVPICTLEESCMYTTAFL